MAKKLGLLIGVVLLLVGILGFVPGATTDDVLIGVFAVGTVLNIIYIVTGLIALALMKKEDAMKMYLKIIGVLYALAMIIGFISGETVLGMFDVNLADNILNLVVALLALYAGFAGGRGPAPAAPAAPSEPTMPEGPTV